VPVEDAREVEEEYVDYMALYGGLRLGRSNNSAKIINRMEPTIDIPTGSFFGRKGHGWLIQLPQSANGQEGNRFILDSLSNDYSFSSSGSLKGFTLSNLWSGGDHTVQSAYVKCLGLKKCELYDCIEEWGEGDVEHLRLAAALREHCEKEAQLALKETLVYVIFITLSVS
jgi:hypothetical protein